MLKEIPLTDLEIGMFVHKMQGNWFDHPFWKSKFLVETPDKLEVLKASQIEGVIIDTAKGRDVAVSREAAAEMEPSTATGEPSTRAQARLDAIKARKTAETGTDRPVSTEKELRAAEAIADKGRERLHRTCLAARLGKALDVRTVQPVVSDILSSVRRNPHAFNGLMRCKLKNEQVYRHALAVSALMISLARQMKLSEQETHEAGMAGLFLDIGVNYLPPSLNPKIGDYRNVEPRIWEQHVILGYRAIQHDDSLPQSALTACLQHHERIDGSGFPNGLAGDDIDRIGRMAAICDTFDHLLTRTEKAGALDPAVAVGKMKAMEGAFDPDILRSFVESVGLYPIGSFVELSSEKLAMVIDEDPQDHARPIVQAFYSLAERERIVPHRIALARNGGAETITGIADLSQLGLPDEPQLRELVFLSAYRMAA